SSPNLRSVAASSYGSRPGRGPRRHGRPAPGRPRSPCPPARRLPPPPRAPGGDLPSRPRPSRAHLPRGPLPSPARLRPSRRLDAGAARSLRAPGAGPRARRRAARGPPPHRRRPPLGRPPVDAAAPPRPEPLPEPVGTPPDLGWSPVDVPIPGDVEKLLQLGPGGDPFTVDERLRTARRAMQRIDWQMGVLLRTFFDLRLHRAFGFPSASRYVAERLGVSARKARALVALERGLRRTPALAAAYREGAVSRLRA